MAASAPEPHELKSKSGHIVRHSYGLERWIQAVLQPARLSGDACWAPPSVASLRLNATRSQHHLTTDIELIAAQCQRE
jgi:hypothetical protein